MHGISTPRDVTLETAAIRDGQCAQMDAAVLSQALVSLATGMEQIEHTLYRLMIRR